MKGLRKLSKRYYVNQILAFLLVSFMVVNPVLAVVPPAGNALPAGGSVPGLPGQYGSVGSFEYDPVNPILHIMDVAEQTVIDWTTFDIGQDALTQFHQLGANPMVLNRVTGSTEPSGIYGQLLANGSVFIVNNYGVVFGPDSFVQARNFVASAIEIGIEDFMVNNFLFEKGIESPYGDVINEGNIEAEGFVALIGRNVTNKGTITVDPGGYVVMAAGERVLLNKQGSEVYVEMFEASIPSMHVVDHGGDGGSGPGTGPGEIVTGSGPGTGNVNVILAAGDIFSTAITGVESLRAEAKGDITLNGAVQATGDITLTAAADGGPGDMWAKSTLTSDTGSIEISASDDTIDLDADVTAAVDLVLNNDTFAADGITLKAGRDVDIAPLKLLTAEGDLTIEATTGEIKEDPFIDMAADSKTLTLTQNDSLNLTTNFNIFNRNNTDLVANSTGGSVNSSEADQWQSIAGRAFGTIDLFDTDSGDDITVGALTADTGDILIHSKDKVHIQGLLSAGRHVKIAAADESSGASILISSDGTAAPEIEAGVYEVSPGVKEKGDIWLGNNTSIDGPASLKASQDIRVGYDENLGIYQPKTLEGEDSLTLNAGRHITLGGDVTLHNASQNSFDLALLADSAVWTTGSLDGKMHAMGTITTEGSLDSIRITASDIGTIDLDDNVTAGYDIKLFANTVVAPDKMLVAGHDVILSNGKTMTGEGVLTIEADRHITLGGDVEAAGTLTLRADADLSGGPLGGNMWAKGTLTTTAGDIDIYASDSTIILSGDKVEAMGDVKLHDNTKLNGSNQRIEATTGTVITDDGVNIDKTAPGNLNINGGTGIELGGDVTGSNMTASDAITFESSVTAYGTGSQRFDAGSGTLDADGNIEKTTTGNLNLGGDTAIRLAGDVTGTTGFGAGDTITFEDDVTADGGSQRFDAGLGTLDADGNIEKTTAGNLNLGGDTAIRLAGDVTGTTGFGAGDTITFEDDVTADGGSQRFDAGLGTLDADGNIEKTTAGNLNLGGDTAIRLAGDVTGTTGFGAGDTITFEDDVTADGGSQRFDAGLGTLDADGNIEKTTAGNLNLGGDTAIRLAGDVTGTTGFGAGDTITFEDDVTADGGSQRFDAGLGTLDADGNIEKTTAGNLNLGGDTAIRLAGDVTGTTGFGAGDTITFEDDVTADGGSQRFDAGLGTLDADGNIEKTTAGNLNLGGDTAIRLAGDVTGTTGFGAGDTITFEDDVTADGGSQRFDAGLGTLDADGNIEKTTAGNLNLGGDTEIRLAGDVTGTTGFGAGDTITFEDDVTADGGSQRFDAGLGTLDADGNIEKTTAGNLNLGGDTAIRLAGDVTGTTGFGAGDTITFEDDVTADGGSQRFDAGLGTLDADGNIEKTTAGNLNLGGDTEIRLAGDVTGTTGFGAGDTITFEDDVTADGGSQRFDAGLGTLDADGNIEKTTTGNLNLGGDTAIRLAGDVTGTTGFGAGDTITFEDDVTADGGSQRFDAGLGTLDADGNIEKTTAGNLNLGGDTAIRLAGDVTGTTGFGAGDTITFEDDVTADGGSQRFDAGLGTLDADGNIEKTTAGNLNLGGDTAIRLAGDVTGTTGFGAGDTITFEDDVTADGGSQRFDAGLGTLDADGNIEKTTAGNLNLGGDAGIELGGNVTGSGMTSSDTLFFEDNVTANATDDVTTLLVDESDQRFDADSGSLVTLNAVDIDKSEDGSLTLGGDAGIELGGNVTGSGLSATGSIIIEDNVDADGTSAAADQRFDADAGNLWAQGLITKTSQGDLYLGGDASIDLDGTVDVDDGSLTIEDDVRAAGDLLASDDVTLEGSIVNTTLDGVGDQTVQAETGTLTATGWVRKVTPGHLWLLGGWDSSDGAPAVDLQHVSEGPSGPAASTCSGNLWIEGEGNVQISGDLTTFGPYITKNGEGPMWRPTGGVAVISNEGKIYTADGGANDTLNVTVEGNSDHKAGLGVDLPHGDGKAAIMIISKEDLKIGSDAQLHASGTYYDDVDDRAGMNLLDEPTNIGGVPRDEGDPFDVAIYVASTEGDVDVSSPVSITSGGFTVAKQDNGFEYEAKGAMVIDAWDTVTFDGGVPGGLFETSLADGEVGDRLEVVSRISEWLFQAVGKLPYVYGGGPFVPGYEYVLRGSGQGNPAIAGNEDNDRAWVLEDPLEPAPLYREAGEDTEEQEFAEGGCPALMAWFADEVGVPEDQIQVIVQNAFAYATDIQPCEACARLRDAATILNDEEGTYMAALGQVVNEFATPDAPIAPEQMTLIASAVASAEPGTNYAAAGEWLDSLVQYVAVMNTEMGYSSAEAVAFVGKYTTPITEGGDVSLVEYVETRLAELGG